MIYWFERIFFFFKTKGYNLAFNQNSGDIFIIIPHYYLDIIILYFVYVKLYLKFIRLLGYVLYIFVK